MSELRMTPRRRRLLQAVADGHVSRRTLGLSTGSTWAEAVDESDVPARRCTAAMETFVAAGLARLGPLPLRLYERRPYQITPAGEAVLATYPEDVR